MTTQLHRQLELNIAALSRGFRQALRYAQKHDPQGTEESSPAWKTVAARQALLLNMLQAVGQFLHPQAEPTPVDLPESQVVTPIETEEAPALTFTDSADEDDDDLSEEEYLATLPPDVRRVQEKIAAVMKWPADTHRQKRHKSQELQRLQGTLMRRLQEWKAEIVAKAEANGIEIPLSLLAPT